jgi:hypothetical protein
MWKHASSNVVRQSSRFLLGQLWHLPGARMQAGAPASRHKGILRSKEEIRCGWQALLRRSSNRLKILLQHTSVDPELCKCGEYNLCLLSTIYKQQNLLAAFLGWNVESILPPLARLTRAWLATHSPGKVINTSCYVNSWSLAASGRAELSICGALTATNNRVLSNRVIAASSLNWFGLPPPLILVVLLHHTINIPSMFWVGSSCFFHYGPCCPCS